MTRIISLGSGSSGNAFLFDNGSVAFFIDCGVGSRTVQAAIRDFDVQDRLAAIVVSHEHIDHVRALDSITKRIGCQVVTTQGTQRAIRYERTFTQRSSGERWHESGVDVEFIAVSHDAAEPCGFVIDDGNLRAAIFTDLGYVSDRVIEAVNSADVVVLEANFDPRMLRFGPYPARLKRRIESPLGHLSNDDCATALVAATTSRTRAVWLAHLSDKNNTPALAIASAQEALSLAGQTAISVGALGRNDRTDITAPPALQLTFGMGD